MSKLADTISKPGILPRQFLKEAAQEGYIWAPRPLPESAFQPASIDLSLGDVAYRLRATFLPHPQRSISSIINAVAEHAFRLDREDGAILENNHSYLLPLEETLAFPPTLRGKTSPKSSIGRLDVFVRVLAEGTTRFDDIPPGYKGKLYALVIPRSFAVVVRLGTRLSQLRLVTTVPGTIVSDQEINTIWSTTPLLFRPRTNFGIPQPMAYEKAVLEEGLFLSADFQRPPKAPLAYKPKLEGAVIDLDEAHHYRSDEYWEPVPSDYELNVIRLRTDEFYLVRCQEKLSIPPKLAAEMLPYDARLGELRSHYAGFFDPGFGYDSGQGVTGTQPVLEIRSRENFLVRHGHTLCRLQFFRMIEEPDLLYGDPNLGSSYQQQRYPFSKHFVTQELSENINDLKLKLAPRD